MLKNVFMRIKNDIYFKYCQFQIAFYVENIQI